MAADAPCRRLIPSVAALASVLALAGTAAAQNAGDRGLYINVPSPLTSEAIAGIQRRLAPVQGAQGRGPSVVVFDFNPGEKDAASADYGQCYNLANEIAKLLTTRTVAYVHGKVTGHLVLPVLTCQQVVCGPQGAVGEVIGANDPPLKNLEVQPYESFIGQAHPAHLAVARKMFDRNVQLRKGKKGDTTWYVDLRERAKAEKDGVKVTDTGALPAVPDDRVALFTAGQLSEFDLSRTVGSRQDVFDAFGLTAAALKDDAATDRPTSAIRYILKGPIDAGVREAVGRVVKDAVRKKTTILFLQLECAGGDLEAARGLAQDLLEFKSGDDGIRVVAFIPDKAPDTAAIVALGCAEIVMSKRKDATTAGGDPAPEAEFGDFEAALGKPGTPGAPNVDFWVRSLRELAEAHGYPPLLIDAMLKRDVEILLVHKWNEPGLGDRLMTDADYQQNKTELRSNGAIKQKGQLLKLSATLAEKLGLARFTVDSRDPADLYAKYGLDPAKVKDAAPSALDRFAEFLKIPAVTVLLVVIGFTGLILELKVPGTTVPGIVAALCFILVFWAHTQFSGQVAVLAGLLFILGLILILLEVFVLPGIGAAGICGVLCMLVALGLVTFNEIPSTTDGWIKFGGRIATYLVGMIASVGLAFLIARFLPNIPYANRLMLIPPGDKPGAEAEFALPGAALAASLLGAVGTSVTVLRPAGSVRFGDQFIDVVTDGGFVPAGSRVQVIEVEGTRIVVKEV